MPPIRILTFNVNGIRSIRDYYAKTKGWSFSEFLDSFQAEILCFQETKANKVELIDHDMAFPIGYHAYFAFPQHPKKVGYSGVVTFVKDAVGFPAVSYDDAILQGRPLDSFTLPELDRLDAEGRVMMTDHGAFLLLNVYFPNDAGPEREAFRNQFYTALLSRVDAMIRSGRSVIIATDWNTVRHPLDHCDFVKPYLDELVPQFDHEGLDEMIRRFAHGLLNFRGQRDFVSDPLGLQEIADIIAETTPKHYIYLDVHPQIETFFREKPSRLWAYQYLELRPEPYRLHDCYRELHPREPNRFTCWNTLIGARGSNYGTRIDYILGMGQLFSDSSVLRESDQMYDVMGSDHCPVWASFDVPLPEAEQEGVTGKPALAKNIRKQQRLDSFFTIKSKRPATTIAQEGSATARPIKAVKQAVTTEVSGRQQTLVVKEDGVVPRCPAHGEYGREWMVKKAGPNRGRKFFLCSRPIGHPTDPEARCNFFQWKVE